MRILLPQLQERNLIRVQDPEMRSLQTVPHCGLVSSDLFTYIYYASGVHYIILFLVIFYVECCVIDFALSWLSWHPISLLFLGGFVCADIPSTIPKSNFQLARPTSRSLIAYRLSPRAPASWSSSSGGKGDGLLERHEACSR
ncbi:hypothetical protein BDR07DRAFT_1411984 [Suillus spraguei]|nr:hypothetical protein BDR07DRAFT_1411984 [Suillus spraguei]